MNFRNGVEDCRWIDLPTIHREEGELTVIDTLPFDIKRVYYIWNIPDLSVRGDHAHRKLEQVMVAMHGEFGLWLDDGSDRQFFWFDNPTKGLYIPSGLWRELINFRNDAVCMVLASRKYEESDYIRNYNQFLGYRR